MTVLFAAWLIDTWTHDGLTRWVKGWWAELSAPPAHIDVAAAVESVVAEAIGYTREAFNERGTA